MGHGWRFRLRWAFRTRCCALTTFTKDRNGVRMTMCSRYRFHRGECGDS